MASFPGVIALVLLAVAVPLQAAPDPERTVKQVRFAAGGASAEIKGAIKGRNYIDYQLRAGAGQRLKVAMQSRSTSSYFNLLPPGSLDAGMFSNGGRERGFDGLLPDDGVYTVRVYLVRAAARRNESASFTLSIGVEGDALRPLPAKVDALVPGTRFHARSKVRCEPAYTAARECDAMVVRRGTDGTATVVLRWDGRATRRILFIKGRPEASDGLQALGFTRDDRGYAVTFGGNERFEIPDALVFGG